MAKVYYWLRLKEGFFKSLAMKKLRRIAGGDTYTIIYLKLQLLSLANEGYLYYEGIENSFAEELALALDEDEENVKVTLSYLKSVNLITEIDENEIFLNDVPNLIGKETDKAQIMRNKRARDKQLALESGNNVTTQLPPVTNCYTEIEIEKEKDIEIEKERESEREIKAQQIVELYNDTCVSLPHVRTLTDKRKKAIKTRLKKYTQSDIQKTFIMAEASDFLRGKNDRGWRADFDWLINENNMVKVLEGRYSNVDSAKKGYSERGTSRDKQYSELEQRIINFGSRSE